MTSFAFMLGVVPLYFSSGASSAAQRAIGTGVFWGMVVGTLLAVFFVPTFYVLVRRFFRSAHSKLNTQKRMHWPQASDRARRTKLEPHSTRA